MHPQVEMNKKVRAQIVRRRIDSSQLTISVGGKNVYITGVLRPLRGGGAVDLKEEMNHISTALRQSCGVADVVWDVTVRE